MINSAYLRHVRLARHYTLNQLSKETGCTASFLSQIERGLKEPSLATLRKISECLDVSLVSFFIQPETDPPGGDSPAAEAGYHIVRRGEGVRLNLPELSARCEMVTAPSEQRPLRGFLYTLAPGEWCSEKMIAHPVDECVYCLSGQLKVYIGERVDILQHGDCLYVNAMELHNFQNCGDEDCTQLTFTLSEKIITEQE